MGTTTEALNNLGSSCDGRLEEVMVAVDDVATWCFRVSKTRKDGL